MTEAREWLQRGLAAHQAGDSAVAESAYRQAIALTGDADAWHMLGMLQHQGADSAAALESLHQALLKRPGDAAILANRAAVHLSGGDAAAARTDAERSVRARPDLYAGWINLGLALEAQAAFDAAVTALEHAHALRPNPASEAALQRCCFALARALGIGGRPSGSEQVWARYFALGGDAADAWLLRANAAVDLGRHDLGLQYLGEARRRAPESADPASAELIAYCHRPDTDAQLLSRMTRSWAMKFCRDFASDPLSRVRARMRRIGFYSPRFAAGPMASLVLPLLQQLRQHAIEVYLYAGFDHVDDDTPRFRAAAHVWRACHADSDAELVQHARADQLDVMVDLCGHAPGNRLRAFALRMAPLQLSWGDWFASTGLPNMDVFFGDPVLTPTSEDACYTERVQRLPHSRFVYRAPESASVSMASLNNDRRPLRFVSLNRISKLTDATVACWSRVLQAVPGSELQLRSASLDEAGSAALLRKRFAHHGVVGARVLCAGFAGYDAVLADYARADIALDPFPFNGCVTTLDALWMGVPVVALRGRSLVARQGASLLVAHGCADWVAKDVDDYVAIAAGLAQSRPELQQHRQALLAMRDTSVLFDVPRFAEDWLAALAASEARL
jgi:protein O-GlcNAc transferase